MSEEKYISKIVVGGQVYKIKAEVTEVYPTTCSRCGASFELHHGEGVCPCCRTHYTTMYKVIES